MFQGVSLKLTSSHSDGRRVCGQSREGEQRYQQSAHGDTETQGFCRHLAQAYHHESKHSVSSGGKKYYFPAAAVSMVPRHIAAPQRQRVLSVVLENR